MRAGVQWRGRWSSEHKDEELIARVSLNVSHWLFQLREPNRGGLDHAFGMRPMAGCAVLCEDAVRDLFHMSGIHETTTTAIPSGLLVQLLSSSSAGKAKQFNSRERKHFVSVFDIFCWFKFKKQTKKCNWIFQLDHVLEWLNKLIPTFIQDHRWTQDGQEMQRT